MSKIQVQIPEVFDYLFTPSRYKTGYGGRGGGKSTGFGDGALVKGIQRPTKILCCREYQTSIAESIHALLSKQIYKNGMGDNYIIQEKKIIGRNGTEIIFKGLKKNIEEIKGMDGIDLAYADEAHNVSNKSWELLIPTIRNENSEIWITFNTKNITDPTYQRFVAKKSPDNICKMISYRDNPFFPNVLELERIKMLNDDPEAYEHVWEGGPDTRRSGAIFAKQLAKARIENRITFVPYNPAFQVFTAWDLGFGDATAIWFLQFVGRELRWLSYYENCGEQLDHYSQIVKAKPYNYMVNGHFLPHDGAHGNIRGDTVSNQLFDLGLSNQVLDREQDITPGIELLRQTINYSAFDQDECVDGIFSLENYGYEWDEERGIFKRKPTHNWASHGASAARYAAIAAQIVQSGLSQIGKDFKGPGHYSSNYYHHGAR